MTTQDGSIPLGDEQEATATPPSKGVLTHCWRRQGIGDGIWHWYPDADGQIIVCGTNRAACEAAAKAEGYEIKEVENGNAKG